MAKPTEKECQSAFKKLQDYLPEGTEVRLGWIGDSAAGFYQIMGGYVIEDRFDPSSMFVLACLDPVVVAVFCVKTVYKMRSLEGAVQWILDSFKGAGFDLSSPEIQGNFDLP
jgi:hypothetical protein